MTDIAMLTDAVTGQVESAQAQDVSNFQGKYDWINAKAKIPNLVLGISRVTQALGHNVNSPDPDASWDWQQLTSLKLDRGGYHFFDPALDGAQQAQYFIDTASKLPGGIKPRDQFWLDNESASGLAPAAVAKQALAFMVELDKLIPHNPRGVYTFINFARDGYNAGLGHYPLWLAYPASTAPTEPPPWYGPQFRLWQWGIRQGADADAFMGTVAEYEAWVASFAPPVQAPTGAYRHVTNGVHSFETIAANRNTTVRHIAEVSVAHYTANDLIQLGKAHAVGVPYYTTGP